MSERFAEQHGAQGGRTTGVNRCASSGTERQGQLATIQKAGGSNPSRRTKSPRNHPISRTFAFHKFRFYGVAFF